MMTRAYQFDRSTRLQEIICYALGDAGFSFLWVMYDSFLLFFLVDIVGLPAGTLTPIVFCSRLADIVMCVLFGLLGERVRTQYGTYRPYVACLALPLSLVFVLMFTIPGLNATPRLLILGTGAAAVLFGSLYSLSNTAYTALLGVLTDDVAVRVRMATLRFAFAAAAVLVVQSFAIRLAVTFGGTNVVRGWSWVAALCAVGCTALLGVSVAGTREWLAPAPALYPHLTRIAREVTNENQVGWLVFAIVLFVAALSCRAAASPFYVRIFGGDVSWTGPILAANSMGAFAACIIVPSVISREWLSPVPLACSCAAAGAALSLLPLLWGEPTHLKLLALQVCFGACTGLLLPTLFALLASPPQNKSRALTPALLAAITLLALKTGSAIGAVIASSSVAHASSFARSSAYSLRNIEHLFTLLPAMLLGLTLCSLLMAQSRRPEDLGNSPGSRHAENTT